MPMPPLFRPEALEAQQQSWLGGIQLIRPLSLSLLTACAAAAAVAVVGYLCWGEYTRKARVEGVLLPDLGVIRIPPPEIGTVLEQHARDGQTVRRGDVLFVLSVDRTTSSGGAQAAVQRSLAEKERSLRAAVRHQGELLEAQRATLERQLADRRGELVQLEAEARMRRERLALAR